MYTGPSLFHISVVRYYPGLRFVTTLYVLGADAFRYYDRHSRVPNVGSWGADLVGEVAVEQCFNITCDATVA
jgi:hypothetical protein